MWSASKLDVSPMFNGTPAYRFVPPQVDFSSFRAKGDRVNAGRER
jgi:hypothetical protein